MKTKNLREIESIINNLNIDLSDKMIDKMLDILFKTESTQSDHELQQWVYVDLNSNFIKKTDLIEEIDWEDLKYWLEGEFGKFIFLKIYHPEISSYKCNIDIFFKDIIDLQKIEGIYSYDFVGIKNIVVLDHNDGKNLPFMRLLCSIETPLDVSIDQLGMTVGDKNFSPINDKFILFDPSVQHKAWNHTDAWWKFFIIDIDKKFLNI